MTAPPDLIAGLVERAARPDYARFEAQLRSSNYCARPVRLRGHVDICDRHGRRRVWSTDGEPDGILRKAAATAARPYARAARSAIARTPGT